MEDHPTALQMYSEGMMGLYLNQLGLNVNVADRFSLVGGLDQNIVWSLAEAAIYMDDPLKREGLQLSEMAPGFGVSVRIEEKVSAATRRIIGLTLAEDPDPMQILHAMKDIAEISSSFNSQEKLRLWQKTGVLFSKSGRGRVLWDDQDMNLQTQVAIGIGFQSDAEVDQIRSQQTLSNIESDKEHAAMFFRKGMIAHMDGDEGSAASLKALAREYSLSENEYNKMAEREFKKMYSGETSDEKTRDKLRQYVLRGADVTVPLRDK
jgi:hypothetical protein